MLIKLKLGFSGKRASICEKASVIKTIVTLFKDNFHYIRMENTHLDVYVLLDVTDEVRGMKERGLLKNKDIFDISISLELIVYGGMENKYLVAQKSADNYQSFKRLHKYVMESKCLCVEYSELAKLFGTSYNDVPTISVSKMTIPKMPKLNTPKFTLTRERYTLPATLNSEEATVDSSGSGYSAHKDRRLTTSNTSTAFGELSNISATKICSSQSEESVTQNAMKSAQSMANAPFPSVQKPARYPKYSTNHRRRQSYSSWPHTNPTVEKCVFAGFFYTGEGDLIRCFHCGIGLNNVSTVDNPMVEHIKHAKSCLFLEAMFEADNQKLQRFQDNTSSLDSENIRRRNIEDFLKTRNRTTSENQIVRSPEFSTLKSRMLTFESDHFRCTKQPEQLAEAGLFYTGVGDKVRCFSCNGGLENWEEHDDPWIEHCKWFPACEFAREVKGDAFIERIQQNTVNDNKDFDLEALKITCIEEIGFSTDIFNRSVQRLRIDGCNHPTIDDIINQIEHIQKEAVTPSNTATETNYEENQRLNILVPCSKCKTNNTNALFLPCAHHLMCIDCARYVKRCPLCNRGVNGIVRTFM